jgi:hypothetical protein
LDFKSFDRLGKSIGLFKEQEGEDSMRRFDSWLKNFFQFYITLAKNDYHITLETERNLFTKCLQEDVRMRLENSILPKTVDDYTVTELIEQTKIFFRRQCNAMVERVRLHRRQQEPSETVQAYSDALKQIAANCRFESSEYDSRLRDIFVAGLCKDDMLLKFYEKDDLLSQTLDQVVTYARSLEGARDSVTATRDSDMRPEVVHYAAKKQQGR